MRVQPLSFIIRISIHFQAGVWQGTTHIGSKGIVLAPVDFVHENKDILFFGKEGKFFCCILEFLDGGHDYGTCGFAKDLFEVFDASCIDRVRESTVTEFSVYLLVCLEGGGCMDIRDGVNDVTDVLI